MRLVERLAEPQGRIRRGLSLRRRLSSLLRSDWLHRHPAIILFGLRNASAKAGWSKHDRTTAFRFSAVTLISWFLLALVLGLAGVYKGGPDRIPTIQYGIFVPFLIGAWLIWR